LREISKLCCRLTDETVRSNRRGCNAACALNSRKKQSIAYLWQDKGFRISHIEVDATLYHYVVVERGQELDRKSTPNYDELLYWIFSDATHNLAFDYELQNRIEDQDCRRTAFPKQIELLSRISPEMGTRRAKEIEDILRMHPYDDEPTKRVNAMSRQNAT
jgi:Immunity protein 63